MYDWNGSIRSLNVGLPDDIARLKAAGYYQEAIARIDRLLAEDWTKTQNGPASNGIAPPEGYVPPENPTPHGVDALREALTVQKEIMRRLPGEYCWTEAEAIARMQERVKDFTAEEFKKLDWEGRMDWRFVEGEKRYQARFAERVGGSRVRRRVEADAGRPQQQERRAPPPPREDGAGGERQRRHHPPHQHPDVRRSLRRRAGKGESRGQRRRPRPGMAGPACRLPVPEPYHAGPLHRD